MVTSAAYKPPIQEMSATTQSINMLVYSDPGAGKTVLAGTAPRATFLATEVDGIVSAKRQGSRAKVLPITTWQDFDSWLHWARRGGVKRGEWWMVDTLTRLQDIILDGILDIAKIETPRIQDYGTWQGRFKKVVKDMNDLPCNMLYTAHTMSAEDEEGETVVLPAINGKLGSNDPTQMSRWVCGTMQIYGYLKVLPRTKANPEYHSRLIVSTSGHYFGKDRYDVLGRSVVNPNIAEIEKLILNTDSKKVTHNAED